MKEKLEELARKLREEDESNMRKHDAIRALLRLTDVELAEVMSALASTAPFSTQITANIPIDFGEAQRFTLKPRMPIDLTPKFVPYIPPTTDQSPAMIQPGTYVGDVVDPQMQPSTTSTRQAKQLDEDSCGDVFGEEDYYDRLGAMDIPLHPDAFGGSDFPPHLPLPEQMPPRDIVCGDIPF